MVCYKFIHRPYSWSIGSCIFMEMSYFNENFGEFHLQFKCTKLNLVTCKPHRFGYNRFKCINAKFWVVINFKTSRLASQCFTRTPLNISRIAYASKCLLILPASKPTPITEYHCSFIIRCNIVKYNLLNNVSQ